jgi:peptidoglycan/xylan/chitin deacetylase (PgdA/CDA1 family)
VVLTFDDGYRDFYTDAFPILKRYGYTATVFLPTAYIDGKRPGIRGKQHLNWDEVRELFTQGITFGSHTVNHVELHKLGWGEIEFELGASREVIESHFNQAAIQRNNRSSQPAGQSTGQSTLIDAFCYPYRFPEKAGFVRALETRLKKNGYAFSVTTRIGTINTTKDLFSFKRVPVNSRDHLSLFSAKLGGGYDWSGWLQTRVKRVRGAAAARHPSATARRARG